MIRLKTILKILLSSSMFLSWNCSASESIGGLENIKPGITQGITITGAQRDYVISNIDFDPIFSDREYSIARNLPEAFSNWEMATTNIQQKIGGYMSSNIGGKVYLITRKNRESVMINNGWVAETPTDLSQAGAMLESSKELLIIWSKGSEANEKVAIPTTTDNYFGGFIPIAPKIVQPNVVEIQVKGNLIDIRELKTGGEVYPQNAKTLFASIPAEYLGWNYATTSKYLPGVSHINNNTYAEIIIAINASKVEGWIPLQKTIKASNKLTYNLFKYPSKTEKQWIEIPSVKGKEATLVLGKNIKVVETPKLPGVLIGKVSKLKTRYLVTNPNIIILPNGTYLASASGLLGGSGVAFYESKDKGKKWKAINSNDGVIINFDKLFVHNNVLYQLGTDAINANNIVIRKSSDNGRSWTPLHTLFTNQEYLAAPTPVTIHNGRVWHSMCTAPAGRKKGSSVISAPIDSDLLDKANWTETNIITWDQEWQPGSFVNWQEGNTVVDRDGNVVVVMRVDESNFPTPLHDRAAIIRVKDENTIVFDPQKDIIDFPGGSKKFTIYFDKKSDKYWSLTNPCFPEDVDKKLDGLYENGISGSLLRNKLALISSPDLINWKQEHILISSNNPFFHGFQYVDWVFDGDDIIAAIRTSFEEERGLPYRQHDANILLFNRVKDFRNAAASNTTYKVETKGISQ